MNKQQRKFLKGLKEQMWKDKLPGGLADDKSPKQFAANSLKAGRTVEREHTSNPSVATEIAMDHLSEDPAYYKKLKKMEKQ